MTPICASGIRYYKMTEKNLSWSIAASLLIITWARSPAVERPLCMFEQSTKQAGGLGFEFQKSPVRVVRRQDGR